MGKKRGECGTILPIGCTLKTWGIPSIKSISIYQPINDHIIYNICIIQCVYLYVYYAVLLLCRRFCPLRDLPDRRRAQRCNSVHELNSDPQLFQHAVYVSLFIHAPTSSANICMYVVYIIYIYIHYTHTPLGSIPSFGCFVDGICCFWFGYPLPDSTYVSLLCCCLGPKRNSSQLQSFGVTSISLAA